MLQNGYDLYRSKRTPLPHWMQYNLIGGGVMKRCEFCGSDLFEDDQITLEFCCQEKHEAEVSP